MSLLNKIHLKPSCIFAVPLQTYDKDFTFIINGEEIRTSRIISDLLSPTISKAHKNDPTINEFIINTHESGDFSHILQLVNFEDFNIPSNELLFFLEVFDILGIESIEIQNSDENEEITIDNVFALLKRHEKFGKFYQKCISKEIDFISSHFYELCENHDEDFLSLSIETLYEIFKNDKLKLKNENQLLSFVNKLYSNNSMYSILYETVLFEYASSETVREFASVFDNNHMTNITWNRLLGRLEQEIELNSNNDNDVIENRYKEKIENRYKGIKFPYSEGNEFKGIINYLRTKSNGQIENEISVTASSTYGNNYPVNVTDYNENTIFYSNNEQDSWLSFDFKEHKIIPTNYTIKSQGAGVNCCNPKNWVIEGKNENGSWETISEEVNCPHLNGSHLVHTFTINKNQNNKAFRYIRMCQKGVCWYNDYRFIITSFEIYGKLI